MTKLPPSLHEALCSRQDGPVRDSFPTEGEYAFPVGVDGEPFLAPLWVARTDTRMWVVAAIDEHLYIQCIDGSTPPTLHTGWTKDTLIAGPWKLPLKKRFRALGQEVCSQWLAPEPLVPERPSPAPCFGAAAKGGKNLPPWVDQIPGEPTERWLLGLETGALVPFHRQNGTIERTPLWVLISDQRAVESAHSSSASLHLRVLSHPLKKKGKHRKTRLHYGRRTLSVRGDAESFIHQAIQLVPTSGSARWESAIYWAIQQGRLARAVKLCVEHHTLYNQLTPAHALTALALEQGHTAASIVGRLFGSEKAKHIQETLQQWNEVLAGRKTPLQEIATGLALELSSACGLHDLPPAGKPPGVPWPPTSPRQTFTIALLQHHRADEAIVWWERDTDDPLEALWVATILHHSEVSPSGKATAWKRAARLEWAANRQIEAVKALEHGLTCEPDPSHWWLRGIWARHLRAEKDVVRAWTQAMTLDPTGTMGLEQITETEDCLFLGRMARESHKLPIATQALQRAVKQAPHLWQAHEELIAVLKQAASDPAATAAACQYAAECLDKGIVKDESPDRWILKMEETLHWSAANRKQESVQALRAGLETHFLDEAAWRQVGQLHADALPSPHNGWYRHLCRVMLGTSAPKGQALEPTPLTPERLDALHPGGVGWLAQISTSLPQPEVPSFEELTRGLDSLREARQDEIHTQLLRVSKTLSLSPPAAFVFRGKGAIGVSVWPSSPSVLILGWQHLDEGPRRWSAEEAVFSLAAELAHLACEHPVLAFDQNLLGTGQSVYQAFGSYAGTAETLVDILTLLPGLDQARKIQTLLKLSRGVFKARSTVDKGVGLVSPVLKKLGGENTPRSSALTREGLSGAALQFRLQADRVGLCVCGSLHAAVCAILKGSSASFEALSAYHEHGLFALLLAEPEECLLTKEEQFRLTGLISFAATRLPYVDAHHSSA